MKSANRLAGETSPYLLQHAHNPVDWYPWGEEALNGPAPGQTGLPVHRLLDLPLVPCHGARILRGRGRSPVSSTKPSSASRSIGRNGPISINIYMAVCQALTGSGGWPLTIVMTPDKRPFFAGTYFPKSRRWGRPGLLELAPMVGEAWLTRRDEVLRSADGILAALDKGQAGTGMRPKSRRRRTFSTTPTASWPRISTPPAAASAARPSSPYPTRSDSS